MLLTSGAPLYAANQSDPPMIKMARATWDTGWFQAEIYKQLLEQLGYRVLGPETMSTPDFYRDLAAGKIDVWVNGWIPSHQPLMIEHMERIAPIGKQVSSGVFQGLMIDKKTADQYGIKSLSDFKDKEIAKLFDSDGDGKAELYGCHLQNACGHDIEKLIQAGNLSRNVRQISFDFSVLASHVLKQYRKGNPVLFYAWMPHYLPGLLKPGQEVYWLPVENSEDVSETHHYIPDCLQNPCQLGFPIDEIQVVANRKFLKQYPDIEVLFKLIEISASDITAQNAKLFSVEDDLSDIQRHAREWLKTHNSEVERWLSSSRALAKVKRKPFVTKKVEKLIRPAIKEKLKVGIKRFEPFVFIREGSYSGLSIDLWKMIAKELNLEYQFRGVNSSAKLLDEVARQSVDLGISGIEVSSQRAAEIKYSIPFFDSGLQIMVRSKKKQNRNELLHYAVGALFSPEVLLLIFLLFISILTSAHIIWWLERSENPQFPRSYWAGVLEGMWWSIVTITTVGYGDKTPRRLIGKLFAGFWMLAGVVIFAYFTANITTQLALYRIGDIVQGPEDLHDKIVVTTRYSAAEEFLNQSGIQTKTVRDINAAYLLLEEDKVDAVVYHSPVLRYYANHEGQGRVKIVGPVFQKKYFAIAFPENSSLIEPVNQAILFLKEKGAFMRLYRKWFKDNG